MSVINKMLCDLDRRQAHGPSQTPPYDARTGVERDTLRVGGLEHSWLAAHSIRRIAQLVTTALAVGGVAAWWYLQQTAPPSRPAQTAQAAASNKVPPQLPASAVSSSVPAIASRLAATPPVSGPASVSAKPALTARPEPVKLPAPAPKSGTAYVEVPLRTDHSREQAPSAAMAARFPVASTPPIGSGVTLSPAPAGDPLRGLTAGGKGSVPTPSATPPSPVRQPAAQEALAQAQLLWNTGSRSAAMDLLQEALAIAEPSGSKSVVASLARELARMGLAEGRVSEALSLLTRLEPTLSGFADIWAIRGNAAQRLGQHPASASAYLMALKLRPNEPRWMLGAAVSLAAQGQTAAAAELAEKARDGGALTPEVANYLRQLGVPLRAD